eukprot:15450561-Alexandrium_andersonii.AAC.1
MVASPPCWQNLPSALRKPPMAPAVPRDFRADSESGQDARVGGEEGHRGGMRRALGGLSLIHI